LCTTANFPMALAAVNQRPIRILTELSNANNINRLVARRDKGIASLKDLRNKIIATQKKSAVHYFLHLLLQSQGLADDAIKAKYMRAEQLPESLADGQIDAFSMREPYVSQAKKLLGDKLVVLSSPGLMHQSELLVAREQWLRQNPDLAARVIQGLYQAEQFARENPAAVIQIMAKEMNVSVESLEENIQAYRLQVGLSQRLILELESQSEWAISAFGVQATLPNFLTYIVPEPLESIKPDSVNYVH
jgi:sulfonate transport system substrate-binding protein